MGRINKIKTRMTIGLSLVFLVAFIVTLVNISSNQLIVNKSQSLLKHNYPSEKCSFTLLKTLDDLNTNLLHQKIAYSDSLMTNYTASNDSLLFSDFQKNLHLLMSNVAEPEEKEMVDALKTAFQKFEKGYANNEFIYNLPAFNQKYEALRAYVLSIHKLNENLLESKNEEINNSAISIKNIQNKVAILGLTILCVLIILLPLTLISPIDRLYARMTAFYKSHFNKEIEIENDNELGKLEEIFEKIVAEANNKVE